MERHPKVPKHENPEQVQSEQEMTRRKFLELGRNVVLAGVGIAAGYEIFKHRVEAVALDKAEATLRHEAELMNQTLEAVDQAMTELRMIVATKATTLSEVHKRVLTDPLDIYDQSRSNPYRNYYVLRLAELDQGATREHLPATRNRAIGISCGFFEKTAPENQGNAAHFIPINRTLEFSRNFRADNLLDVSTVYHELDHARADTALRQHYKDNRPLYEQRRQSLGILSLLEQIAYTKQLTMLNLVLDGRLEEDIRAGNADSAVYAQLLNTRPDQQTHVETTLEFARRMYLSGSTLNHTAPSFATFINKVYGFDNRALKDHR